VPPPGLHAHAAEVTHAFAPVRAGPTAPRSSTRRSDRAPTPSSSILKIRSLPNAKRRRGRARLPFCVKRVKSTARPRLLVRVNGLHTGLTDDDLDAIVPARPDAIMLPKAEGAAAIVHGRCQADRPRSDPRIGRRAHQRLSRSRPRRRPSLFLAGTYGSSSPRLFGLTWGAEDLSAELGAEANRDRDRAIFSTPIGSHACFVLPAPRAARVDAIDTVYVDFRNDAGLRRECEEARRDGFTAKMAIHPGQVQAHQRGIHADVGSARNRTRDRGSLCRDARHRNSGAQWRDVRPTASCPRDATCSSRRKSIARRRLLRNLCGPRCAEKSEPRKATLPAPLRLEHRDQHCAFITSDGHDAHVHISKLSQPR